MPWRLVFPHSGSLYARFTNADDTNDMALGPDAVIPHVERVYLFAIAPAAPTLADVQAMCDALPGDYDVDCRLLDPHALAIVCRTLGRRAVSLALPLPAASPAQSEWFFRALEGRPPNRSIVIHSHEPDMPRWPPDLVAEWGREIHGVLAAYPHIAPLHWDSPICELVFFESRVVTALMGSDNPRGLPDWPARHVSRTALISARAAARTNRVAHDTFSIATVFAALGGADLVETRVTVHNLKHETETELVLFRAPGAKIETIAVSALAWTGASEWDLVVEAQGEELDMTRTLEEYGLDVDTPIRVTSA